MTPASYIYSGGTCVKNTCVNSGGSCPEPYLYCCQPVKGNYPGYNPDGCSSTNNNYCTNLYTDLCNCGSCGNNCTLTAYPHPVLGDGVSCSTNDDCTSQGFPGHICSNKLCYAPDNACCDTVSGPSCNNTISDPINCGSCGNVCSSTNYNNESNTVSASSGDTFACCSGGCIDTSSDLNNCGSCGNSCTSQSYTTTISCGSGNPCPSGGTCSSGTCSFPANACCGSACTNTNYDPSNCGSCGNNTCSTCPCQCDSLPLPCPLGDSCCSSGYTVSSDGKSCQTANSYYCANIFTDPCNCARCGNECLGVGIHPACCEFEDPNGALDAGCKDTASNPDNCGDCGIKCPFIKLPGPH